MRFLILVIALLFTAQPAEADFLGQLAPDFEGAPVQGGTFHLADHIGREMVVLNFFATDCAPCREEMPALDAFSAAHKGEVALLGVTVLERASLVKSFLDAIKVSFPTVTESGELSKKLDVTGWPTTVVIGVDGKIQFWNLNAINVDATLGPLLQKNKTMLENGQGISGDAFMRQTGGTIKLVSPEATPVAGFSPNAQKDEIFSITVATETPQEMDVDVDYYYAGGHGEQRIYIDCDPHTADGGAPFAMRPAVAQVGRHTARAPMMTYDGTPSGTVSVKITCNLSSRIDSAQMATRTVEYEKAWGK